VTHAGYIRDAYLDALEGHVEALRSGCRDHAIELVEISTADSLGTVLSEYLAKRMAYRQPVGIS